MERRAASHTEEEELNQRRRLLSQARKGDPKAISRLFELYQVRVFSGDILNRGGRLPQWPTAHQKAMTRHTKAGREGSRANARRTRRTARRRTVTAARRANSTRTPVTRKASRKARR